MSIEHHEDKDAATAVFVARHFRSERSLTDKFGGDSLFEKYASTTWNPKQPFINGCFNWMIPNLFIENGCFTKHPFKTGCLGFQEGMFFFLFFARSFFFGGVDS